MAIQGKSRDKAPSEPARTAGMTADAEAPAQKSNEDELTRQKWRDVIPHDRMQMVIRQPFTGALAMQMPLIPVIDARVPTACTDGKTTYFNPYFFEKLKPEERRFVLSHEVWHSGLSHFLRRGTRDPEMWNIVTDLEINRMLKVEYGKDSPKEALYGENIFGKDWEGKGYNKMAAEELYTIYEKQQQGNKRNKGDSGSGQSGQSSGGPGQPGDQQEEGKGENKPGADGKQKRGKFADEHQWDNLSPEELKKKIIEEGTNAKSPYHKLVDEDGMPKRDPAFAPGVPDKNSQTEWNQRIVQTAQRMQQRGRGTLPAEFQGIVDAITSPKIPWKHKLSRFTESNASGQGYDWTRARRRYLSVGAIMPDRHEPRLTINVAMDNSGSVSDLALAKGVAAVAEICDLFPQYEMRLIQCDADVSSTKIYSKEEPFDPKDFVVTSRGGTAFTPVFEHIEKEAQLNGQTERTPLIYFTDGEGDKPKDPGYPVLWVLIDSDICTADFGEKIIVSQEEMSNDD